MNAPLKTIAQRMAEVLLRGGDENSIAALYAAGFTGREIAENLDEADCIVAREVLPHLSPMPASVNLLEAVERCSTLVRMGTILMSPDLPRAPRTKVPA